VYTPLHNAARAASGDLVELLIARGHPVDIRDPGYGATPLEWALHDCLVEKRHPQGEFARVVGALLAAGSPLNGVKYPTGDAAVDETLHAYSSCAPKESPRRRMRDNESNSPVTVRNFNTVRFSATSPDHIVATWGKVHPNCSLPHINWQYNAPAVDVAPALSGPTIVPWGNRKRTSISRQRATL
jgi:hypothetical protein